MERRGDEVHVETTEASGGSKEGVVRWVLIVGTLLAIALLSIIWITGALTRSEFEEEGDVSGQISTVESDDSIAETDLGERFEEIEAAPEPTAAGPNAPPESEAN